MAQQFLNEGQIERAQELLLEVYEGREELRRDDFAWRHAWREARRHLAFAWKHTKGIVGMAVSPDGRLLASSDQSGTLLIGDPRSETPPREFESATTGLHLLAFDPSGSTLLASGEGKVPGDQQTYLLDAATARPRGRIGGLENRKVTSLAFLARGQTLAFATTKPDGSDPDLRLFDMTAYPSSPRLRLRVETAQSPDLARQGDRIAVIDREGAITTVDSVSYRVEKRIADHAGIGSAIMTPDAHFVAGSRGNELFVWDLQCKPEPETHAVDQGIVDLKFLPDRKTLCVQTTLGSLHLFDVTTWEQRVIRADDFNLPRSLVMAIRNDGEAIATNTYGHPGGSSPLSIWNAASGERVAVCPGRGGMPEHLAFAPDGRTLYIARDRWVSRWNLDPCPETLVMTAHTDEVWGAKFSPGGSTLVTTSDDTDDRQTVKFWSFDPASAEHPLRLRLGWHAHNATVSAVAYSPDGKTVATVSLEKIHSVMLWDAETGRLLAELQGHTDWVRAVDFSPDGKLLATAGTDAKVRVWDVESRRCIYPLEFHRDKIRAVAFSPGGSELVSAGNDHHICIWDVNRGALLRAIPAQESVVAVDFSPDGSMLAAADASGFVLILDTKTRQPLRRLPAEVDELICLAFSASGQVLATAGISGTISLWDPHTGQELLTLEGHEAQVNALAFNHDDTALVSCDHSGQLRLWRADP
jgi:WD40 repeat protein